MRFIFSLLVIMGVFVPDLAFATPAGLGVINPMGGNAWDLYVYGNGRIIFYVLNSIKMLMVPDVGNTMFNTLLLLMGSIGFLALAVGAGFDPGKNLMRMFTYIIVVWAVSYGSTKVVVNVTIVDKFAPPTNQAGVVSGVPALVALPAVLISQVGEYFTNVMETYFSLPDASDAFKTGSKSGVPGQFNLFAKMMSASDEYVITSPELKKSLSAYMSDCVVPAIAMNRLIGPGKDGPVTGANALLRTTNMMETMQSAQHNSIMTKYYPMTDVTDGWRASVPSGILEGMPAPAQGATPGLSFGVVVNCSDDFNILKLNLEANARLLLDSGNAAWAKAGVLTPFESVVQSMLAQTAAPGSAASGYSSPAGYILQQTMLNSTSGAFRSSAIMSGNNELMQAAALSQAEQSQKSAWAAGFEVFNNMMGYVYTVLQAFIFAITPIMVIALMVPGLGKKIFTNYLEILIWLSLWMPMLALINFIITLFGTDSLQTVVGIEGGLSANNKVLMSEKTKDLILAAQFLGTMVPLLTWGLVKGALAFTEFISQGVGSAFASQAGASAATGNMSLNNMSMNNTSMNKYDTSMSSAVGTQAVTTHNSAGSMLVNTNMAGGSGTASGSGVDYKKSVQDTLQSSKQQSEATSKLIGNAISNGYSDSQLADLAKTSDIGSQGQRAIASIIQKNKTLAASTGNDSGQQLTEQRTIATTGQTANQVSKHADTSASIKAGGELPLIGGGSLGASTKKASMVSRTDSLQVNNQEGVQTSKGDKNAVGTSTQIGNNQSLTSSSSTSFSDKEAQTAKTSEQAQRQAVLNDALQKQTQYSEGISRMLSTTNTMGMSQDVDIQTMRDIGGKIAHLESSLFSDKAFDTDKKGLEQNLATQRNDTEVKAGAVREKEAKIASGINPHAHGPSQGQIANLKSDVAAGSAAIDSEIVRRDTELKSKSGARGTQVDIVQDRMQMKGGAIGNMLEGVDNVDESRAIANAAAKGETPAPRLNSTEARLKGMTSVQKHNPRAR
ncbi:MAG: conjugal transfer protein TraG N-terminal domain-containing protein [Agitococcus sp.]|nr:conjugal transfer protein TraG N-terminal domain-containing protein [Agitococcus sp.]MDO9176987.1 conjugal transfer protein TraG N-terminal domain-containing protein [Agitococcus sp.]